MTEGASDDAVARVALDELMASLCFDPLAGQIWLDGRRMVLVENDSLGLMRRELIAAVGHDGARAIMTRHGHEMGALDAAIGLRAASTPDKFDGFSVGPHLHALKGVVRVISVIFDVDVSAGKFYVEYDWLNSAECEAHLAHFGVGATPAGWSQLGYASGYASAFIGRSIVYREVECKAMGFDKCRLVGRPAEDWDDGDDDLRYLRAERYPLYFGSANEPAADSEPIANGPIAGPNVEGARFIGASAGFNLAFHMIQKVAATMATVLFLGESGVGKEMFARQVHQLSHRAKMPFVAINCAAIPETLVEAELFGVEKGAFTGAASSRPGRFERSEGGTLLLDEVGSLSLAAQGKLLRVLQEREIERVGGVKTIPIDVRVMAATNQDLRQAVADGRFRADLFYRLNIFPVRIPPLRERRADIPLLLQHFIGRYAARYNRPEPAVSKALVHAMMRYDWPGNVRELENVVERGVILVNDGELLGPQHLFAGGETLDLGGRASVSGDDAPKPPERYVTQEPLERTIDQIIDGTIKLEDLEGRLLRRALHQAGGNKSAAGRLLGMTRAQIDYRLGRGST